MLILGGIIIGFLASFISALFGGGSGLIMVPSIYWLLTHAYPHSNALMQMTFTTGSCMAIPLGMMASYKHAKYKNIDGSMLRQMIFPMMFGGVIGVITIAVTSSANLKSYFSVAIALIAVWLFFHRNKGNAAHWPKCIKKTIGAIVGFISTTLGVSVFSVPLFIKFGLDIKKAIGTSTVIVLSYSAVSAISLLVLGIKIVGISHGNIGYLSLPIFLSGVIPSLLGSMIGAKVVSILPQHIMKYCFIILMLVVSGLMFISD